MADRVSTFPLRLRDPRLRELVREVAAAEGVSQNEVIEHAILDEMVTKGRLLAVDLQIAVDRLNQLTEGAHRALVERSIADFGEGEAHRDPVATRAMGDLTVARADATPARATSDELGVLAAFETGYH